MSLFDDNFDDFFEGLEEELPIEDKREWKQLDINFKYRGTKRIKFQDIPEGLIKVLAVDTGIYEYNCNTELPDLIIRKYELKRV